MNGISDVLHADHGKDYCYRQQDGTIEPGRETPKYSHLLFLP
jgi:hypothetical protein